MLKEKTHGNLWVMITWNRSECFKVTWRIYWKSTINEQYPVLLAIIGDFDHWHENLFKIEKSEKFNTFVAQLIRQTPFVFKCVSFWSTNSRAVKFKNGIWWALKKQTKLLFLSLKINLKLKSMLKSSKSLQARNSGESAVKCRVIHKRLQLKV